MSDAAALWLSGFFIGVSVMSLVIALGGGLSRGA